jgi:hypothetical protein
MINRWSRRSVLGAAMSSSVGLLGSATAHAGGLLQAQGNKLFYSGRQVRLRGVAVGDPLLARLQRPTDDFRVLARTWHCNLVRISVHPSTWRDRQAEAMVALERDVTAALANRMWVIIDWHAIGWPDEYSPDPLYDTNWNLARSFWQAVAARFGMDGRIAFELWNEPLFRIETAPDLVEAVSRFGFDASTIKIESAADAAEAASLLPLRWLALRDRYQELLAIIRAQSNNLVLLGGNRSTYDLRDIKENPVEGSNIGYTWHVYAGQDNNDPAEWATKLDDLDRIYPVIVTEWGFCRTCVGAHFQGTPEEFGRPFMRYFLNGRQMSWTAWVWHPDWSPAMLQSDWRTPTEFGRFVMSDLAQGVRPRP